MNLIETQVSNIYPKLPLHSHANNSYVTKINSSPIKVLQVLTHQGYITRIRSCNTIFKGEIQYVSVNTVVH